MTDYRSITFHCEEDGYLSTVFEKKNGQKEVHPYKTEHCLYKSPNIARSLPITDQVCPFCKGLVTLTHDDHAYCLNLKCPGAYMPTLTLQSLMLQLPPDLHEVICSLGMKNPHLEFSDFLNLADDQVKKSYKKILLQNIKSLSGTDFMTFMRLPKFVIEDLTTDCQPMLSSPIEVYHAITSGQFKMDKLTHPSSFGLALSSFGIVNRGYVLRFLDTTTRVR
jgi:hypothetical protein